MNIPESKRWIHIEKIEKGWSEDHKYHVVDDKNEHYLLRIFKLERYQRYLDQYQALKSLSALRLPVPYPYKIAKVNDKMGYILLAWMAGEDLGSALERFSHHEQYQLGKEAGEILFQIHQCFPAAPKDWESQFEMKKQQQLAAFKAQSVNDACYQKTVQFLESYIPFSQKRSGVFCHGDFHVGNLLLNNGHIAVIDFDRCEYEQDAYDEFKPFCWNVKASPYFASGIIDGYFKQEIPRDFFCVLSGYAALSVISQYLWSLKFGEEELHTAKEVAEMMLDWFDQWQTVIPRWYISDRYVIEHSSGAVVQHQNQFLVVTHQSGHTSFSKGHLEPGETPEMAAIREIREETGLDVQIDLSRKTVCTYYPRAGHLKEVTYFLAETKCSDLTLQEAEIKDAHWLSKADVLKVLSFENDRIIFKNLLQQ